MRDRIHQRRRGTRIHRYELEQNHTSHTRLQLHGTSRQNRSRLETHPGRVLGLWPAEERKHRGFHSGTKRRIFCFITVQWRIYGRGKRGGWIST